MQLDETQIKTKVNGILADLFELEEEQLTPEKHMYNDLGLDSLDAIDLVVRFQKELNITPANEDLQKIRTLADVYNLVLKYHAATA